MLRGDAGLEEVDDEPDDEPDDELDDEPEEDDSSGAPKTRAIDTKHMKTLQNIFLKIRKCIII